MAKIVTYSNPILRRKAESLEDIDDTIRQLIDEMGETMYANDGVGLAAPQVGVSKRVVVLDGGEGLMSLVNPEIIQMGEEEETMEEGCLSLPEIRLDVSRPTRIVARGRNDKGELVEMELDGLLARIFQHEIDHLNGILIIDHASSIQRTLLKSKLKKLKKEV